MIFQHTWQLIVDNKKTATLSLAYLAESDQLVVASSQGISRHDLPRER
jgi:hypothetical protein